MRFALDRERAASGVALIGEAKTATALNAAQASAREQEPRELDRLQQLELEERGFVVAALSHEPDAARSDYHSHRISQFEAAGMRWVRDTAGKRASAIRTEIKSLVSVSNIEEPPALKELSGGDCSGLACEGAGVVAGGLLMSRGVRVVAFV